MLSQELHLELFYEIMGNHACKIKCSEQCSNAIMLTWSLQLFFPTLSLSFFCFYIFQTAQYGYSTVTDSAAPLKLLFCVQFNLQGNSSLSCRLFTMYENMTVVSPILSIHPVNVAIVQ